MGLEEEFFLIIGDENSDKPQKIVKAILRELNL